MKRLIFVSTLTVILTLAFSSCRHLGKGLLGSGVRKTEKRDLGSFKSIEASGAYEIFITCQQTVSFEIEGDDNILPTIKTEAGDGVLRITSERDYNTQKPIVVRISVPDLERLSSAGAEDVRIENLKNDKFATSSSGAARVVASGQTKFVDISSNGAGDIDTTKLLAERAKVTITGVGNVDLYVSQQLDATVSGVGNVTYSGNPSVVNKSVSGFGSVNKKQ